MSSFGLIEKNMELSHIYLAVKLIFTHEHDEEKEILLNLTL